MRHVIFPMCVGFIIYLIYNPNVYIIRFCTSICPSVQQLHVNNGGGMLEKIIRNYACDFLWAYALTAGVFLWENYFERSARYAMSLSITFAFFIEIIQVSSYVPGTFDYIDLLVEGCAIFMAFIMTKKMWRR